VFRAGQMLQQFPDIGIDGKRISVLGNNINSLPAQELRCQKLVTLFLGKSELKEIPEAFLHGLTSLKVLDLGGTQLKSLPLSLWELKQLEFLNLSWTEIENLHGGTGNLYSLQFLYISHCIKLRSLPSQIGKLESLKYLDYSNCDNLKVVPKEITRLSNCKIVQ
jgi:disease resistance protein RPS2